LIGSCRQLRGASGGKNTAKKEKLVAGIVRSETKTIKPRGELEASPAVGGGKIRSSHKDAYPGDKNVANQKENTGVSSLTRNRE